MLARVGISFSFPIYVWPYGRLMDAQLRERGSRPLSVHSSFYSAFGGYREFWELFWASITISETEIVWSCPLRPTHVIQVDDCIIGMENEISGCNMTYPHIYFSKQPYPREFSNKIQKIPNSDNFIKFRYRADLADYLVEHLPKQKTFKVAYYR